MNKLIFSKSFKEFLNGSDSRVSKFIYRVMYDHYDGDIPYIKGLLTTEEINYLTFRTDGTISYLPAGKEHITNDEGEWTRENRQSGKPSKVIRKILSPKVQRLFSDKDYEQFANSYKATGDTSRMRFSLLPNTDIPKIYCHSIEEGNGPLNGSCMNGDEDYVSFYCGIKEVQILALFNENDELAGRALVWDIGDNKFMDRMYVVKDHYYDLFLSYALERKWVRKVCYKTYDNKLDFTIDGENTFRATYKFSYDDHDYYPYIDTFSYGDDYVISNFSSDMQYEYNNTDGTRNGDNEYWDEVNGRYISEDDAIYIERGRYRGHYIHHSDAVEINGDWWWDGDDNIACVKGTYYHIDDCTRVNDMWYLSEDCVYCEHDECDYLRDDCTELHDGTYCLTDDAVEVDGNYYHKDSTPEIC